MVFLSNLGCGIAVLDCDIANLPDTIAAGNNYNFTSKIGSDKKQSKKEIINEIINEIAKIYKKVIIMQMEETEDGRVSKKAAKLIAEGNAHCLKRELKGEMKKQLKRILKDLKKINENKIHWSYLEELADAPIELQEFLRVINEIKEGSKSEDDSDGKEDQDSELEYETEDDSNDEEDQENSESEDETEDDSDDEEDQENSESEDETEDDSDDEEDQENSESEDETGMKKRKKRKSSNK